MRTKSNTEAKLQSLLKGSKRRLAALKQKAESTGTSRRNIEAELANRIEDLSTMENIARAKALNGKPGRQVLTFEERRGLRLEYRGPRKLVFTYRYRAPDGYVKQLKIGRWPATSWEKACTKWEALSDARDEGRDPRQERLAKIQEAREKAKAEREQKRKYRTDVAKIAEAYLTGHTDKQCAPTTIVNVRSMFKKHVGLHGKSRNDEPLPASTLGAKSAAAIDRADAEKFLAELKESAPQIARLLRIQLARCWDYARSHRLLDIEHQNPWRGTLIDLPPQHSDRYLNDRELAVLLKRLPELGPELEQAFRLALYCGVRTGSVTNTFNPSDIDLERGTWRIALHKGKHRQVKDATYNCQLPRQAVELLRARKLRPFQHERFKRPLIQHDLSEALRAAGHFGLEPFTPHVTRHTAITGMTACGVPRYIANLAAGKMKAADYDHHGYAKECAAALQKWCDHIEALEAPSVVAFPKSKARRRSA